MPVDYLDAVASPPYRVPSPRIYPRPLTDRIIPSPQSAFRCCQSRRLSGFARNLLQQPLALLHVNSPSFDSSSQRLTQGRLKRTIHSASPPTSSSCFLPRSSTLLPRSCAISPPPCAYSTRLESSSLYASPIFYCATVVLLFNYCPVLPRSLIATYSVRTRLHFTASSRTRLTNRLDEDQHDC